MRRPRRARRLDPGRNARRVPRSECAALLLFALSVLACQRSPASGPSRTVEPAPQAVTAPSGKREVRATGTVQAIRQLAVQVPQIRGLNSRLTLVRLIPNGSTVREGDLLAEFDRTQQIDNAREALAKYEDFCHQVDQKIAENRTNAEKRGSDKQQAAADLAKAQLQLRKGPVLNEIERLKNEVKLRDATARLASLEKSHQFRQAADDAAQRILELRRDRQKVALERAEKNAERLEVRATLTGMVAHQNTYRSGSMGPPQEGDQMYPGQPLLRIFDPTDMEVDTQVAEPDGAVLVPGTKALVYPDAYPGLVLTAHLVSASPVATSAMGSPIKKFSARFRLDRRDPHLLPDLAAAVIITVENAAPGGPKL